MVTIVANKAAKEKCPVFILDTYISKLPEEAKKNDLFYCRAIQNEHGHPAFLNQTSKSNEAVSARSAQWYYHAKEQRQIEMIGNKSHFTY